RLPERLGQRSEVLSPQAGVTQHFNPSWIHCRAWNYEMTEIGDVSAFRRWPEVVTLFVARQQADERSRPGIFPGECVRLHRRIPPRRGPCPGVLAFAGE